MLQTAAILLGVLIIVAGITLMFVTGLDPKMVAMGLVISAGGGALIWWMSKNNSSDAARDAVLTAGRSYQKPLPPPAEKPKIDKL